MGPELTDRVIGPVVDFVQQNRWAFVEKVGAYGGDGGGGTTDVEPEGREMLPTEGRSPQGSPRCPSGCPNPCPVEGSNSRQPQSGVLSSSYRILWLAFPRVQDS